jgi:hypothetical protein
MRCGDRITARSPQRERLLVVSHCAAVDRSVAAGKPSGAPSLATNKLQTTPQPTRCRAWLTAGRLRHQRGQSGCIQLNPQPAT